MSKKSRRRRGYMIRCVVTAMCIVGLVVSAGFIMNDIITSQKRAQLNQSIADMYPVSGDDVEDIASTKKEEPQQVASVQNDEVQTVADASVPANPSDDQEDVIVANVPNNETQNTSLSGSLFNTGSAAKADEFRVDSDFQKLYERNPDLVGMLDMGTTIHEPIVQRDNEFYLDHNFDGKSDNAGTLFANEANTLFPTPDQNILLHGHNMRDDSVLGSMDKFRDASWLKKNPIFYLRLVNEEAAHPYVPIAFFDASVSVGDPNFFDININFDQASFDKYIGDAKARSLYKIPVDVNSDDQLLTVVTCSYVYNNSRFIMVARALREDETIDDMKSLVQSAVK